MDKAFFSGTVKSSRDKAGGGSGWRPGEQELERCHRERRRLLVMFAAPEVEWAVDGPRYRRARAGEGAHKVLGKHVAACRLLVEQGNDPLTEGNNVNLTVCNRRTKPLTETSLQPFCKCISSGSSPFSFTVCIIFPSIL